MSWSWQKVVDAKSTVPEPLSYVEELEVIPEPIVSAGLLLNPGNQNQILLMGGRENPNIYIYNIQDGTYTKFKDNKNYHRMFKRLELSGIFLTEHRVVPITKLNQHYVVSIGGFPAHWAVAKVISNRNQNVNTTNLSWQNKIMVEHIQFDYKRSIEALGCKIFNKDFVLVSGTMATCDRNTQQHKLSIFKIECNFNHVSKVKVLKTSIKNSCNYNLKKPKLIESIMLPTVGLHKQAMILFNAKCIKKYQLFKDLVDYSGSTIDNVKKKDNFAVCLLFGGLSTTFVESFVCVPINFDNYYSINISNNFTNSKIKKGKLMIEKENLDPDDVGLKWRSKWLNDCVIPEICQKTNYGRGKFFGFSYHLIKNRFIVIIGGYFRLSPYHKSNRYNTAPVGNNIWYFDLSSLKLTKSKVILPMELFNHSSVVDYKNECIHIMGGKTLTKDKKNIRLNLKATQAADIHWVIKLYDMIDDWPFLKWQNERIVWIAYVKNHNNKKCCFNKVGKDVVKTIPSFFNMML